jgi:hypothetical protein
LSASDPDEGFPGALPAQHAEEGVDGALEALRDRLVHDHPAGAHVRDEDADPPTGLSAGDLLREPYFLVRPKGQADLGGLPLIDRAENCSSYTRDWWRPPRHAGGSHDLTPGTSSRKQTQEPIRKTKTGTPHDNLNT